MKKLLFTVLMLANILFASAQNYDTLYIQSINNGDLIHYCTDEYDGVVVYGEPNWNCQWQIGGTGELFYADHIELSNNEYYYRIIYLGSTSKTFYVYFHSPLNESPFAEPLVWKRQGETITLTVDNGNFDPYDYEWLWSNDSDELSIDVTAPGTYSVTATSLYGCGSNTFSIQVCDNVEVELATCDLETNLNMVTWPTTPAQAEYVSQVEIKRDGLTVGTAPYTDGYFLDNIGSDAASRTYTVTAIATDGTPCPITSYPKETIHMAYLTGINNTIEVNWNAPTGYELIGYNICEWNATDGTLTAIDYVGASVSSYTCQQSQFDQGYIVIQGVEASKDGETRLLSNRSSETVGIGENNPSTGSGALAIYPNPTNGQLKIEAEGIKHVSISNTLGLVIYEGKTEGDVFEYDFGKHEAGVYLVRIETARGVAVKKVTVTR